MTSHGQTLCTAESSWKPKFQEVRGLGNERAKERRSQGVKVQESEWARIGLGRKGLVPPNYLKSVDRQ